MNQSERAEPSLIRRIAPRLKVCAPWLSYLGLALACTFYLNRRAKLVPSWGQWYQADPHPYVLLQVRAFLSGRLALFPHPSGAGNDYDWGRAGMHQAWGLGVSILATPFHVLGRLFGAPGFPDDARFLILYAVTTFLLASALHGTSNREPKALAASCAAAGFVMVFPTYVGMIASRFEIYEQTIATGALWSVLLLAGVLALLHRCTPPRLAAVCAAAGFVTLIRPPLAVYGFTTLAIALIIARTRRMGLRAWIGALVAYAGVTALYFVGNALRFGCAFCSGYENTVSGAFVNRMTRWGLPFAKVPFKTAAREMFETLFYLEPVSSQMFGPPPSLQPYAVGERWREYYAPTFDQTILVLWTAAFLWVGWRVIRHRLWRRDQDLGQEIAAIVGAWAIPPSLALFVFYARIGNLVTRYATDLYPAFAAAAVCVGMAIVHAVRRRAPGLPGSAQLAIAGVVALYLAGWRDWVTQLSQPADRKGVLARIADIDAHSAEMPPNVPNHFKCNEPRGRPPVHSHLADWSPDCSFRSGMVFALPQSHCVSFTFRTNGVKWGPLELESLAAFRATSDFDTLKSCGPPTIEGEDRVVTMCDPHRPAFLLDGMRLYSIASLDENLNPIDRLRLMRIDPSTACR